MIVSAMTHRFAALYVVRDWPCLLFFVLADDVYTVFVNARALAWFVFSCCCFFANDAHSVCAGCCCEGGGYTLICTLLCMLWHAAKRKSVVACIVFKLMPRFGV